MLSCARSDLTFWRCSVFSTADMADTIMFKVLCCGLYYCSFELKRESFLLSTVQYSIFSKWKREKWFYFVWLNKQQNSPKSSFFFSLWMFKKKHNNLFVFLLFLFLKSSLHLNYFPPLLIFFFVFFFSPLFVYNYIYSFLSILLLSFIVEKRSSHGNSVSFCSQVFVFILRKEWIYINCL